MSDLSPTVRQKATQKFEDAFAAEAEDAAALARHIEAALVAACTSSQYNAKARQLVANLNRNKALRASVIQGEMTAEALVSASPDELATKDVKRTREAALEKKFAQRSLGETDELVVGWASGTSGKLDWSHKYESEKLAAAEATSSKATLDAGGAAAAASAVSPVEADDDTELEEDEDEYVPAAVNVDEGVSEDAMAWLVGKPAAPRAGTARKASAPAAAAATAKAAAGPPSAKRQRVDEKKKKSGPAGVPLISGTSLSSTAERYGDVLVQRCTLAEAGGSRTMSLLAVAKTEAEKQMLVEQMVAKVRAVAAKIRGSV